MIKMSILGGGNLAQHLIKAFLNSPKIEVVQVYNRSIDKIQRFSPDTSVINTIQDLKKVDVYLICVSDQAIPYLAANIKFEDALVLHTSGSTALDVLNKFERRGVFYPLQTFSKDRKVDFSQLPIGWETSQKDDEKTLKLLAKNISNNVFPLDSKQRLSVHIAAVFVNNFVNHLYEIGHSICKENNIDSNLLYPLLLETALKVEKMPPYKAQTGPAKRQDHNTIKKHLEVLTNNKREIYKLLSDSISHLYENEL